MALKSQSASDLRAIVKSYVFASSSSIEEQQHSKPDSNQASKFTGNHQHTQPRKLFVPPFLDLSLKKASIWLRDQVATERDWSENFCSESYIISAILHLGFNNIFKNTKFLQLLNETRQLTERALLLDDSTPEYAYQSIHAQGSMRIFRFPSNVYSNLEPIQPRIPTSSIARLYNDSIAVYNLDKDNDGGRLIQLCLMQVLHNQPFVRSSYSIAMQQCLQEINKQLHQKMLQLRFQLEAVAKFSEEWNKLESEYT